MSGCWLNSGDNISCNSVGFLPSVLWNCWSNSRKSIQPVKKLWAVCLELGVYIWFASCNWHVVVFCFIKIQNSLPFWCRITPGGRGKEAVKQVSCCCLFLGSYLTVVTRTGTTVWRRWMSTVLRWRPTARRNTLGIYDTTACECLACSYRCEW